MIIGRKYEIQKLDNLNQQDKAHFVAVYGRRRVGKTYLIKEFFKNKVDYYCVITGHKAAPMRRQLEIFQQQIEACFYNSTKFAPVANWAEGFAFLENALLLKSKESHKKQFKFLVFLDEIPWLATNKSGLLEALDYSWNTKLQNIKGLRLVICGSAASWIINNVINNKGGLHNRLTSTICLMPFTFQETKEYLTILKKIDWSDEQILELYLIFGGIPYYLELLNRKHSVHQNIAELCFGNGELSNEFNNLYKALFDNSEYHLKIIYALSAVSKGLTREQILEKTKQPSSRQITTCLSELIESGFIISLQPLNSLKKNTIYRLIDEFSIFYLKQVKSVASKNNVNKYNEIWIKLSKSQSFVSWRGYAFENYCNKNYSTIAALLGFGAVIYDAGPWLFKPIKTSEIQQGLQIDLLFDRADGVITICEIKFSENDFIFTKKLQMEMKNKIALFKALSKTKKTVQVILLTNQNINLSKQNIEPFLTCLNVAKILE